jgi:hypothetical protein
MPRILEKRHDAMGSVKGPDPRRSPTGHTALVGRDSISAEWRATEGDLRLKKALVR